MNEKWIHPADEICTIMKRVYDRDLTTLTGGNLSCIDKDHIMWVTPTAVDKGSLTRNDIIKVFSDGRAEGNHKPTSEFRIHHRILMDHPEYRAVLHAHSPALVTMSLLHEIPETRITPTDYHAVSKAGLAEYASAGTEKLSDYVVEVFNRGFSTAVLKNHAAFLASRIGMKDAFLRFEQFDHSAQLQLCAETIGSLKILTEEKIKAYEASLKKYSEKDFGDCSEQELTARRELTAIISRAYRKKLFTGMSGCASVRAEENTFIISPLVKDNGCISEEDFVKIDAEFCEAGKAPDETAEIHQAIYKMNPEVNSIIIAAPIHAGAFAITDRTYEVNMIPESYLVLKNCDRISFDTLVLNKNSIGSRMSLQQPFGIIENFGVLLVASSPVLAFDKLEVAECTAISIIQALNSGKEIKSMTKEQQDEADFLAASSKN